MIGAGRDTNVSGIGMAVEVPRTLPQKPMGFPEMIVNLSGLVTALANIDERYRIFAEKLLGQIPDPTAHDIAKEPIDPSMKGRLCDGLHGFAHCVHSLERTLQRLEGSLEE